MIKSVRGTRDLLPPETALWNFVEATARDVFRDYNFQEIRTPVFEDLALFQRSVGEETDIVSKEMFAWQDRGRAESDKGQWLALRPENTAGVTRPGSSRISVMAPSSLALPRLASTSLNSKV